MGRRKCQRWCYHALYVWMDTHALISLSLSSLFCSLFVSSKFELPLEKINANEVCKHARMGNHEHAYVRRPVLVRIRERYVHLHWPEQMWWLGEKKSGNSGQHSKTYKRFNNMTFWTFSSTWGSSWSIWRISHLFAFFKFERKWKLFAKRKKKCYIALWIICVLWTFNLLDSISISNN